MSIVEKTGIESDPKFETKLLVSWAARFSGVVLPWSTVTPAYTMLRYRSTTAAGLRKAGCYKNCYGIGFR